MHMHIQHLRAHHIYPQYTIDHAHIQHVRVYVFHVQYMQGVFVKFGKFDIVV